jgi:uncharacterized Fe-S cluster protein YjdI/CDGSH-type Zn-finger protein
VSEQPESERIKEYTSPGIVVTFSARRCIHSANCVRGLPEVFDTKKRPWIQPNNAEADTIAEVVMRCPTGALHFRRLDGGPDEPVPDEVRITAQTDGPLYIRGPVRVYDDDGNLLREDVRLALCRCGHSKDKPFCDESHKTVGFKSSPEIETAPETA